MIPAIRAEFRKLRTTRTTYVFVGLALAFVIFYAGYIEGWRLKGKDLLNPYLFNSDIVGALNSLPLIFGAIIAILLMTHEYRYNTIMYSLTLAKSRTSVLAAKVAVLTLFALVFTAVIAVLSPLSSYVGIMLHGNDLIAQNVFYADLVWRSLFYGWGMIMLALLLATLIRNQIGAIVSLFVLPTIEQILALLLKHNAYYLPMMSLGAIMESGGPWGTISHGKAAIIFSCYLVVGWVVAWVLFVRRSAN